MPEYHLGNCLRGHFKGVFAKQKDAWEILSRRFLMSYPSSNGRFVQMHVREKNTHGLEDTVLCREGVTTTICSFTDKEVSKRAKPYYK